LTSPRCGSTWSAPVRSIGRVRTGQGRRVYPGGTGSACGPNCCLRSRALPPFDDACGAHFRRLDLKSQTKSQRPQTQGVTRPRPATVVAGRYHVGRQQATLSDGTDASYKRGVRRFKSYCAHNFRILDSACRSAMPRSRRHTLPEWGKSGAASGCRERRRHVPVLLGMEALARQPGPWSATAMSLEMVYEMATSRPIPI
jgi:hypothetical protein